MGCDPGLPRPSAVQPGQIETALAALLLGAACAAAAVKLTVTVVDPKTGKPVTDLKAGDFSVLEDKTPRRVEAAEYETGVVDVMLLLDTSLVGEMVAPVAGNLAAQLGGKEQMAVVSYHSSADMIQDFTASQELLRRAIAGVRYGNTPRALDALFAAIDGGFEHASFRRVILLVTAGFEGPSRVSEREVARLARKNGVSIYPVYATGVERGLFENLARQTGGACFNLRDMQRNEKGPPGPRIFEVVRGRYTLTVSGNLELGEKLKVEVKRPGKLFISALPVE